MLNQQKIADHIEIQQLMVRYANAIDRREFERLDAVFTPNAYIDYTAMGGIADSYPIVKAWLPEALGHFTHYQHFVGNIEADIQGDHATARVACYNPAVLALPPKSLWGGSTTVLLGLWYVDELIRTDAGWRISKRVEEKCYMHNRPLLMRIGQWWLSRSGKKVKID